MLGCSGRERGFGVKCRWRSTIEIVRDRLISLGERERERKEEEGMLELRGGVWGERVTKWVSKG